MRKTITLIDAHSDFEDIDYKLWKKIVHGFMKFIAQQILEGHQIYIPRIGKLFIEGNRNVKKFSQRDKKGVDWKATRKAWADDPELAGKKFYFHFNDHTDGYHFKWKWSQKGAILAHKSLYRFKPTYTNQRGLTAAIRSGQEYIIKMG